MKRLIPLLFAAAMALASCNVNVGSRDTTPLSEKTFSFDKVAEKVSINVPAEVVLVQGEETSVSLSAREKTLEELEAVMEKGRLYVRYTTPKIRMAEKNIVVVLTTPYVKDLVINGAAELRVRSYEASQPIKIEINGAGDLEINGLRVPSATMLVNGAGDLEAKDLDCRSVKATVNGAGDLKLAGRARTATVDVNGAGDVDVRHLSCEKYIRK